MDGSNSHSGLRTAEVNIKALRISFLVHGVVLILCGCAIHRPVLVQDAAVLEGRDFVAAVSEKVPQWDADEDFARYERFEIATVKADIAMATNVESADDFLKYVGKLHRDWDSLVELDERLRREDWI